MTKLTPQELDERIRAELLDLLNRVVPQGGLKYENLELLKKHVDLTIDNLKPTYRDCIEAVTPKPVTPPTDSRFDTPMQRGFQRGNNSAINTIEANTKKLLD